MKRAATKPAPKPRAVARLARRKRAAVRASAKPKRTAKPARALATRSGVDSAKTGAHAPAAAAAPRAPLSVLASTPLRIGSVTHYFPRASAAQISLDAPLVLGDQLHVRGASSDFLMPVTSLRIGGASAARVDAGAATLLVPERARRGDVLFLLRAPV